MTPTTAKSATGGVQSIERAFGLLESMADLGGIASISDLATALGLPLPTVHRLIRTLVDLGYVRQEPSRKYALGPRLLRLGDHAGRLFGTWAMPYLSELANELGETAQLAMLDQVDVVFVAHAPGSHAMRMVTEAGRRRGLHSTSAGKAMLAAQTPERALELISRAGLKRLTPNTITDPEDLFKELARIRKRGYAIDEGEQEEGVRCIGVALPGSPARAAVSVSGPVTRMTPALLENAIPMLKGAAGALAREFELANAIAAAQTSDLLAR